jgi:hypothetical protein
VAVPTTAYPGKIIGFALLALVFVVGFYRPQPHNGLTTTEAEALWVVRDDVDWEITPRGVLRGMRADATQLLERIRQQPQPPLYFALLDGWTLLVGESVYAVRWLSMLLSLGAVAVMVAAWRRVDWLIVALIGFGLSIYAAQTIYTTSLVLMLAAICTWLLLRQRVLLYAIALAALLYTHHIAAPFVALQFLLVMREPRIWRQWGLTVIAAGVIFAPWLLLFQSRDLDPLLTVDGWTQSAIALSVAAVPVLIGSYTITRKNVRLVVALSGAVIVLAGAFISVRAINNRPDWPRFITTVNIAREDLDATLYAIPPRHPLWHYDGLADTRWRYGIMIDLGWRDQTPAMLADVQARLGDQTVWLLARQDFNLLPAENVTVTTAELQLSRQTP